MEQSNAYYSNDIVERVLMHAHRLVDQMCTIRDVAEWSGYSKSTVHLDLSERLLKIDGDLYEEVQIVINLNLEERDYRGGKAIHKNSDKNEVE